MPESTYGNQLRKKNTPLALQPVDPVLVLLGQHYREQFQPTASGGAANGA